MTTQVPLRCRCGTIRGIATDVSAETGNRIVCLCTDCQAYAHWLGTDGILDRDGGTDIFQMTPAQLTLTAGAEHLRCVRLSEKGLMRWYAGCCRTPICNTVRSPGVPFVGVVHDFMDHAGDGRSRDAVLGPPLGFVNARSSPGGVPAHAHPTAGLGLVLRAVRLLVLARIAGKHRPSPLFDPSTGAPVVTPLVLTTEEREALRSPR